MSIDSNRDPKHKYGILKKNPVVSFLYKLISNLLMQMVTKRSYRFPDKKTRALEIRLTQLRERGKRELQVYRNHFLRSSYKKEVSTAGSQNFMGYFTRDVKIDRLG